LPARAAFLPEEVTYRVSRNELATVSDNQCSWERSFPHSPRRDGRRAMGGIYSLAKGVTVAHITVAWFDGKDASERLNDRNRRSQTVFGAARDRPRT